MKQNKTSSVFSIFKMHIIRIGLFFLSLVYGLLKLLPTQNKFLFISKLSHDVPFDFIVLHKSLQETYPQHKVVMLCHPIDNKVRYVFHIIKQLYHLATSKVVFLERSCLVISAFTHKNSLQVIQLWHALGSMKKFGFAILDTKEGQSQKMAELFHMHRGYTSIIISSLSFLNDFLEGFRVPESIVVQIPLPRVDTLMNDLYRRSKRDEIIAAYCELTEKINILYCPTHRECEEIDAREQVLRLVNLIDYTKYNLIYCRHPLSNLTIDDHRVLICEQFVSQELLHIADYLISDYSSIIYEAGLLEIPVYLYAYDWESYKKVRMYNLDPENDIPALFTDDAEKIIRAIQNSEFDHEAFREFVDRNVAIPKTRTCCGRIIDLIANS